MLQQNEITELYNQCFAHERKVVKLDIERLKLQFAKAALFGKPWFDPPPVLDEHSAIDKTVDLKIRRQLWEAKEIPVRSHRIAELQKYDCATFCPCVLAHRGKGLRTRGHSRHQGTPKNRYFHQIRVRWRSVRCLDDTAESLGLSSCMRPLEPGLRSANRSERRRWLRLPLAVPVFVRGRDRQTKEFLEFSTLLNESAGGALLATRRNLRRSSRVRLEIPSAPLFLRPSLAHGIKTLRATVVWIVLADGCSLCGLRFARPIAQAAAAE